MFRVVTMVFQQVMTELNGAETEEDNSGHHKNCIKTHEAKWLLEFIGPEKL
jgi:hypothetical protein